MDYVLKEGFERGVQQGIEKGRHEEKLNNALAMKKRGIDTNLIAELLGLSLDQVEKL